MKLANLCRVLFLAVLAAVALPDNSGAQAPSKAKAIDLKQLAYIKASNTRPGSQFGAGGTLLGDGVALSSDGNTLAVGAPAETSSAKGVNGNQSDESAFDAGAVYVFTRSGNTWKQQAYVKASNTRQSAHFGYVVRLSGDGNTMAVSAYFESGGAKGVNGNQADDTIPEAGAVYVFVRTGNTWKQQAYIKASNTGEAGVGDTPGDGDQFGFSLALSNDGNTLAVGAIGEDSLKRHDHVFDAAVLGGELPGSTRGDPTADR